MFKIVQVSIAMAWDSLTAHKIRAALTLLGVLVGLFSITLVMTAMRIMQNDMERELSQLGTHTFEIQRLPHDGARAKLEKYKNRRNLTYAQVRPLLEEPALAGKVGVQALAAYGEVVSRVDRTNPNIYLYGVTPETFAARNWVIAAGRGLTSADLDAERNVCVIGDRVARKIFPQISPLGETIKFERIPYTVVGVLEPKGEMFGEPQDNLVAIPLSTVLKRYGREIDLAVLVQAHDRTSFEALVAESRGALRKARKVPPTEPDDFEISSNDILLRHFLAHTRGYRVGAAIVGSIALFAAGIGIMNIMLVAVTERTREIGVRRAIGARKSSIVLQFVVEAIVTCQIGGIAGIALGIVAGNLGGRYILGMAPAVPFDWAFFGLAICCLVGVVFGAYPAIQAARVDPIEALRHE